MSHSPESGPSEEFGALGNGTTLVAAQQLGKTTDIAGVAYWDRVWDGTALPPLWIIDGRGLESLVERRLFQALALAIGKGGDAGEPRRLIEVGCARSCVLPLLARRLGFRVAGLDYSAAGCAQTRALLQREEVPGTVYHCDLFAAPAELEASFDVVVSFGLVEHFADTGAVVAALARLLRPGGVMFTSIPHMRGLIGLTQRLFCPQIYHMHVPLGPRELEAAHLGAGLVVERAEYFLATNFGVVNPGTNCGWTRRKLLAVLRRVSWVAWWFEERFGDLPPGPWFSPYVICVARKVA